LKYGHVLNILSSAIHPLVVIKIEIRRKYQSKGRHSVNLSPSEI
jgi:hypothetical protein